MFLDVLTRRNPALVEAAIALHQSGRIPAGSFVLDLDTMVANARVFMAEAKRLGLTVFAMTKQFGRNPVAMDALASASMDRFVAVDMACARRIDGAGHTVGHVGHLVQIPVAETRVAAAMHPDYWTVFDDVKAEAAGRASAEERRDQPLLARIHAPGDTFYPGHEGGYEAADVAAVADRLDAIDGVTFAGITTFPALIFDGASREVRPTHNLGTLAEAAGRLRATGRSDVQINAPGTTSTSTLRALADAGATQVEPGHAMTGTTPLHAVRDLEELPAAAYVTEVSHHYDGRAYCFGNGMYVDPVFPDYAMSALVGREPELGRTARVPATIPPPSMIDYYGQLQAPDARPGDTVVFGFRMQAFVTRAFVVPIRGVSSGTPYVAGIFTSDGAVASWPR